MASGFLKALLAIVLTAQTATSGRAPTASATADLSGTWTLDTYLSDKPAQVAAAIRTDLGQRDSSLFPERPTGGRFGRGSGRRGQPSPPGPAGTSTPPNAEEQRALDDITAAVRYPPPTLQISQTDTSVTLADPQGRSRTFQTNGKREQQLFESARADSTARWEGPQLVVDFDLGKGRKMTYTYAVVPTTRQLLVRIVFEPAPNQPAPFEIKYVYDRAPAG
jgi:hypothetical protein